VSNPYLSIIVAVRNDNYGGDFNARLQNFISWNTRLLEEYKLKAEIVLVNWNPIEENQPLQELFNWPQNRKYVEYKIVEVTNAVHKTFVNEAIRKTVPLFEFVAKNAGIRRCSGEFILCTNADIMLSESLVEILAQRKLKPSSLYRAIRLDFQSINSPSFSELEIKKNCTTAFLRTGGVKLKQSLGFALAYRLAKVQDQLRKWALFPWLYITAKTNFYQERKFLFRHAFNACGDFALLDRKSWLSGCHYHENTRISTHTDSIHLLTCLSNGIKPFDLDGFVYHQEHERRFNFSEVNPDMDDMFSRLLLEIRSLLNGNFVAPSNSWGCKEIKMKEEKV
jgi:hypothetical protein